MRLQAQTCMDDPLGAPGERRSTHRKRVLSHFVSWFGHREEPDAIDSSYPTTELKPHEPAEPPVPPPPPASDVMSLCAAPPAGYQNAVAAGVKKAKLPISKTFVLAILSGTHIGFGAFLALTIGGDVCLTGLQPQPAD